MKKSLKSILLLALVLGMFLLGNTGCKKSEEAQEYSLLVNLSLGATGTPRGGLYVYEGPTQQDYAYTLKQRYTDLLVKLDGNTIDPSGTISITGTHILDVTATPIPGDFLLSVTLLPGVIGSPETGNFFYNRTELLPYNYSLEEGYTNLRVQLDGVIVANTGTITFERNHTLNVFADKYYDIRGTWTLEENYEDDSSFTVTLTFSGGAASGTVTDSDGGRGTWTTSGPKTVFTLVYPQVNYSYDGTFSSEERVYGYCSRQIASGTYNGQWQATRTTTSTTSGQKTAGKGR